MSTADPYGAQAHARAQGGTQVESMPTLPASAAKQPPAGVDPADLIWEETVAPYGYAAHRIDRGGRLRLVDVGGDACASLLIFNAEQPIERLNVADTAKVQWDAYLRDGSVLLSDMGRALASILEDQAGTHDLFCGASNQATNARKYGSGANHGLHPNARDRFMIALAKHGLGRKDVHPCVNLFKGVKIEADGATTPSLGPFKPGREVLLRAEMNLLVVLVNCPHVLDTRTDGPVTPLRVTAWRGPITGADDPIRMSSPERTRAFLNTDDYYAR